MNLGCFCDELVIQSEEDVSFVELGFVSSKGFGDFK